MPITSHNDADLSKEQQQIERQRRVISTHNVVPFNRPIKIEDTNAFIEKRKAAFESEPAQASVKKEEAENIQVVDESKVDIQDNLAQPEIPDEIEPLEQNQPQEQEKPKRGRKPKEQQD